MLLTHQVGRATRRHIGRSVVLRCRCVIQSGRILETPLPAREPPWWKESRPWPSKVAPHLVCHRCAPSQWSASVAVKRERGLIWLFNEMFNKLNKLNEFYYSDISVARALARFLSRIASSRRDSGGAQDAIERWEDTRRYDAASRH